MAVEVPKVPNLDHITCVCTGHFQFGSRVLQPLGVVQVYKSALLSRGSLIRFLQKPAITAEVFRRAKPPNNGGTPELLHLFATVRCVTVHESWTYIDTSYIRYLSARQSSGHSRQAKHHTG